MRRNEKLLRLASVLEICDEHDLTDDCVFMYCCKCVNDLADISIEAVQRQLDKPEIRSCRIPLVIDLARCSPVPKCSVPKCSVDHTFLMQLW